LLFRGIWSRVKKTVLRTVFSGRVAQARACAARSASKPQPSGESLQPHQNKETPLGSLCFAHKKRDLLMPQHLGEISLFRNAKHLLFFNISHVAA
jgi:hypothetical protein